MRILRLLKIMDCSTPLFLSPHCKPLQFIPLFYLVILICEDQSIIFSNFKVLSINGFFLDHQTVSLGPSVGLTVVVGASLRGDLQRFAIKESSGREVSSLYTCSVCGETQNKSSRNKIKEQIENTTSRGQGHYNACGKPKQKCSKTNNKSIDSFETSSSLL